MLSKRILIVFCAFGLLGSSAGAGFAQTPGAAPAASAGAAIPEQFKLDLLVRTTVIAINQANVTGNYTVFRDLTTPVFQSQNSPARLAEIFATLRKRNLDLSPVVFFPAKFQRPPAIESGYLHLTGYFPTKPEQVNFDFAYQNFNGRWLVAGVSLNTAPNNAPTASAAPAAGGAAPAAAAAAPARPAKPRQARPQPPRQGATDTGVEPRTTANFAKVDLGQGSGNSGAPLPERRPSDGPVDTPAAPKAEAREEAAPAPAAKPSVWPF